MTERARWLRCAQPRPEAASRLVCLPHAGGSASFYREWARLLPASIEVHAVQYPGRADRLLDPMVDDAQRLAGAIATALAPLADRPLALFGHSMGAVVAYEVARAMRHTSGGPAHLFVSGSKAPHDDTVVPPILDEDDDALVANIAELGGTEAELLADPDMRELALPYVRNDLRLIEGHTHHAGPELSCPVTALVGDADSRATPELAARWAELTTGRFRARSFRGGHFYLAETPDEVLTEVTHDLSPFQAAPTAY